MAADSEPQRPDLQSLAPDPQPRAEGTWQWLLTPRGKVVLAGLLFGLSELFSIPILVIALVVMPYRGGAPAIQAEPTLFWICLAAVISIPALCSLFLYFKLNQSLARLPSKQER